MSTYWGYACVSHDPALISEHWFNHGEDVLTDAFHLERAGAWPDQPIVVGVNDAIGPDPEPVESPRGSYLTTEPIHWLRRHPHCRVVLHNQYGETQDIPDRNDS